MIPIYQDEMSKSRFSTVSETQLLRKLIRQCVDKVWTLHTRLQPMFLVFNTGLGEGLFIALQALVR